MSVTADNAGPATALPVAEASVGPVLRRNFWSLADQGAVSLGTVCTNILLARALDTTHYGAYALVFGVLLFLNNLHGSLITYPLTVKGAAAGVGRLRELAGTSLLLTLLLWLPLACAAGIAAYLAGQLEALPWIAAGLLMWQFQETTRRALMAQLRYRGAVWGDATAYLGLAACVWYLTRGDAQPSQRTIFGFMALTFALGAAVQLVQLRLRVFRWAGAIETARAYTKVGGWMVLTNLIGVLNIQAVSWTLAAVHGLAEAAKLQALGILLGVTHPAIFGISNLIIPAASQARWHGGVAAAWRATVRYGGVGAALVLPYYLLIALCPDVMLNLFYGADSPYRALHTPLRVFAVVYTFLYFSAVLGGMLYGLERSRAAFVAQVATVATAVLVGLPLAAWGGVTWALVGRCASGLCGLVATAAILRRVARQAAARAAAERVPAAAAAAPAKTATAAGIGS